MIEEGRFGIIKDLEPLHHPQLAQQASPTDGIARGLGCCRTLSDLSFFPAQFWRKHLRYTWRFFGFSAFPLAPLFLSGSSHVCKNPDDINQLSQRHAWITCFQLV